MFKPTHSNFRKQYGIPGDKYIVLGVSFAWGYRKGLDCFVEMAEKLDERYQIVLVGTDDEIDKNLPQSIISIHRTQNQKELAEIYSAADVFAMPTREENYPTVNMEAIACGTPVVTFDTGGCAETVDTSTGIIVSVNEIDKLIEAIDVISQEQINPEVYKKKVRNYSQDLKYMEYLELYSHVIS